MIKSLSVFSTDFSPKRENIDNPVTGLLLFPPTPVTRTCTLRIVVSFALLLLLPLLISPSSVSSLAKSIVDEEFFARRSKTSERCVFSRCEYTNKQIHMNLKKKDYSETKIITYIFPFWQEFPCCVLYSQKEALFYIYLHALVKRV